ncbi:hypothetical protein U91I_03647 [alpha proteobacterium U9-1i]|nr:hypothetical protein U91I_03647 [alpha proteobacterium U9-1i]
MSERISVSSADFVRNIGVWQERALHAPIAITYHGRERLVLLAAESFSVSNDSNAPTDAIDQLSAIVDNMAEGFVAIADDYSVVAANHVAEGYFGRSRRSMEGTAFTSIFPALKDSLLMSQVQRVMRAREAATFELESIVFPGRRLECRVFPLSRGVGILFVNVTEREALRGALAEAEAMRAAASLHPDIASATCDPRGRLLHADARFCAWVGFEPSAILHCRFVDIVAPASRREVGEALERALDANLTVTTRLLAKDLTERQLTLSLSPITSVSGTKGVCILATTRLAQAETSRVA